ncbi:MAG: Crp/Fnr family transcriptional regulator [Porticoccus sp.]|nr:Crp/Fnr family transcriptional regulator [Porticoccus sp.]
MISDILRQYVHNNIDSTRQLKLDRHEYLYTESEPANEIYFVDSGLIMITKLFPDGSEVGIMLLSDNKIFGHCEVLSGIDREYQAMALTSCNIWAVKSKNFLNEMKNSNEFSLAIAQLQNENIRQTGRHISTISHCDVTKRLINTLGDIAQSMGRKDCKHTYVRPCPTHQDLATMIASTRETVSVIMGKLRRENLIDFDRKELRIFDEKKLAENVRTETLN